jgi:hypothetical protein
MQVLPGFKKYLTHWIPAYAGMTNRRTDIMRILDSGLRTAGMTDRRAEFMDRDIKNTG